MSKFDKIIGYETVKNELVQICDILKNQELYQKMGAKLPQGMLLNGDPGLGKTLMAKCLIEESGLKAYTVRRNKGKNNFVSEITKAFEEAKKNAPSIILLDDMDKFANEDERHRDAEEYVAVQAGIDDVKDCNVFVIATVNNKWKLPDSLVRLGRFDRQIDIEYPSESDALKIIEHILSDKSLADDFNLEDLSKMISFSSCAKLETILNEATINATYERRDKIEMADLVKSALKMVYNSPDTYTKISDDELKRVALHEAGHLVVCESICPGSVGLASVRTSGRDSTGGFIHRCRDLKSDTDDIMVLLAGKAAVELYYADSQARGCSEDIRKAYRRIRRLISNDGTSGFGMIDVSDFRFNNISESMNSRTEAVTQAELEHYLLKARNILIENREFLEKTADALAEKETLLYSDIQKIKKDCKSLKKAS